VAQACLHWIEKDVINDAFQFSFVSHTMVVRFVLPKRPARCQQAIAPTGRKPFEAMHDRLARRAIAGKRFDPWWKWPK
jgi:hypothetical protein